MEKQYKAVFFDLGGTLRIPGGGLYAPRPSENGGDRRHGYAL